MARVGLILEGIRRDLHFLSYLHLADIQLVDTHLKGQLRQVVDNGQGAAFRVRAPADLISHLSGLTDDLSGDGGRNGVVLQALLLLFQIVVGSIQGLLRLLQTVFILLEGILIGIRRHGEYRSSCGHIVSLMDQDLGHLDGGGKVVLQGL